MQLILASASIGREFLLKGLKIPYQVVPSQIDEDKVMGKCHVETVKMRAKLKGEDVARKLSSYKAIKQKGNKLDCSIARLLDCLIVSADTEVIINKQLLGKPKNYKDAVRMLKMLSGKTHEVVSGYYIIKIRNSKSEIRKNIKQPKIPILKTELNAPSDRAILGGDTAWQVRRDLKRAGVSEKFGIEAATIWHGYDRSRVTFRRLTNNDIKLYLSLTDYTRFTGSYALIASPQNFITKIEGSISNVIGLPLEKVIPIFRHNKLL